MSNHNSGGGWLMKSGLFIAIVGALYVLFNRTPDTTQETPRTQTERPSPTKTPTHQETTPQPSSRGQVDVGLEEYLPTGKGEIVRHKYFTLAYDEDHEQAAWVVYRITRERLNNAKVERTNQFLPDPEVRTESATSRDYNGSGYDRGHLCPAADMAFDTAAMAESFYMSNISPQDRAFNAGIWRELEELTRDWGRRYEKIIVVTGPVLTDPPTKRIGFSKVTVPQRFYRVILTKDKTIGFILPNQVSDKPVMDYACPVDAVEKATGIDFFPKVLNGLNEELEALYDRSAWPVNDQRYQRRVTEWNTR